MTVTAPELTEDALTDAIARERARDRPGELVLLVGSRARLNADRIIRSPGGPLYQVCYVRQAHELRPDEWKLLRVPSRRPHRRRS